VVCEIGGYSLGNKMVFLVKYSAISDSGKPANSIALL
jgi:hypothetical protein